VIEEDGIKQQLRNKINQVQETNAIRTSAFEVDPLFQVLCPLLEVILDFPALGGIRPQIIGPRMPGQIDQHLRHP
jgi:hypothetical protein